LVIEKPKSEINLSKLRICFLHQKRNLTFEKDYLLHEKLIFFVRESVFCKKQVFNEKIKTQNF